MDILIRLVKVDAGAPDYSCLGHANDGRAILFEYATVGRVWHNGAADAFASALRLLQREILSQTPMALWTAGRLARPLHASLRASVSRARHGASIGGHSTQ